MAVDWRALADAGFSCFPLKPRDKKPFGEWKRFQTTPPTDEEIANWSRRPDNNGAVVTGAISNIIVLDTDSPEADAEAQRRGIPVTPTVRTAKGCHYYFRHLGRPMANFVRREEGMDLRGDGGYVVAAGSVHPSGHVYQWVYAPFETELADPPEWLLALIDDGRPRERGTRESTVVAGPWVPPAPDGHYLAPKPNAYAEAALDRELAQLRRAGEGKRNIALNTAAYNLGQLVAGGGLAQAEVERSLMAIAVLIGLDTKEAQATIGSGLKAGAAQPRTAPEPRPGPPRPAARPACPLYPSAAADEEGSGDHRGRR
ncbi:hypothetical protein STVA_41590 [Allostella vacuolata]|nr:hypothetical protein STVA_41590 [Stella vacuolata]